MAEYIEPELCTLVDKARKLDGYRIRAKGRRRPLYPTFQKGLDWTHRFEEGSVVQRNA